ncbi:hypothetical protein ACMHYB_45785 [Sorangium sp. So ce1128]
MHTSSVHGFPSSMGAHGAPPLALLPPLPPLPPLALLSPLPPLPPFALLPPLPPLALLSPLPPLALLSPLPPLALDAELTEEAAAPPPAPALVFSSPALHPSECTTTPRITAVILNALFIKNDSCRQEARPSKGRAKRLLTAGLASLQGGVG